jgi:hypothetical protein
MRRVALSNFCRHISMDDNQQLLIVDALRRMLIDAGVVNVELSWEPLELLVAAEDYLQWKYNLSAPIGTGL